MLSPTVGRMRIIPARAGFTSNSTTARRPARDHPRSRGVYSRYATVCGRWPGSSPLARGLPSQTAFTPVHSRIIPARAGFTSAWKCAVITLLGSSPLARGLHGARVGDFQARGIIPARAGFTWRSRPAPVWRRDHPRSRGVYAFAISTLTDPVGSSPLARGLQMGHITSAFCQGIIPARAGFTPSGIVLTFATRDHPRSRGVYPEIPRTALLKPGSSPLARGLPYGPSHTRTPERIIPARAGFTERPDDAARKSPDHPRSRGVYVMRNAIEKGEEGSSPLARGLRAPQEDEI